MRALARWVAAILIALAPAVSVAQDPYETYVKTSRDFTRVKQDARWLREAFPGWVYMPWTYQWTIGYDEASARWSREMGYNGAFMDHGDGPNGKLAWINNFRFPFYTDHLAGKGDLFLKSPSKKDLSSTGVRPRPINAAMLKRLKEIISQNSAKLKNSPMRVAYALDDEISWGKLVQPTMWRVTDDEAAYGNWLKEVYGAAHAPTPTKWYSYDDIRPRLRDWTIGTSNAGPLMDQWSFNDSVWANLLGDLVTHANSIDPQTPCGFVGGQSPNAFGGYDYVKLMRKIQYLEAYNIGSSQAIARSFNPKSAMPLVTTHFHKNVNDTIWQTWYYLAHGNRGMIGWVEGWFKGKEPAAWHAQTAPTMAQAAEKIGPIMRGAAWVSDGVAIYYSQASIQLGWIFDAEAHGKTWPNRNNDFKLGASHLVRKAWENMLRDSGIQYDFLGYADVIQNGVPKEYKVVILPAVLCLSDAEAKQIRKFVEEGGTVIADYLPGLWDQHGKGRAAGGVLDDLFGVKHDPNWTSKDLFGGKLWCEVNQDDNFSPRDFEEFMTKNSTCIKDVSGFNKVVRKMPVAHEQAMGKGKAVLMNLSPQWYNAYRDRSAADAARRIVFMKHIPVKRWARLAGAGEKEFGYEITYFDNGDRRILFICQNPAITGLSTGGGNSQKLKSEQVAITLEFDQPITGARDERTGKNLPNGKSFKYDWKMNEAVVISFARPKN